MSDPRGIQPWLMLISGLVTLFLWTSEAAAAERLRPECVGEAGFAATGTLQWLNDDGEPLDTAVTRKGPKATHALNPKNSTSLRTCVRKSTAGSIRTSRSPELHSS